MMTMAVLQELQEKSPTGIPLRFYRHRITELTGGLVLYLHWHEQYEIIFVQRGHATFHIDGETVEVRDGDVIFIPPNCLHSGYNASDGEFEYVAIVISPEYLSDYGSDPQYEQFVAPFVDGRRRLPLVQSASDESAGPLRKIVRDAIREFENVQPLRDLVFKHHLQILFALAARRYLPGQTEARRPSALPIHHIESLKKLIRFIENNYSETISVESAARMVNLSTFHFCKMFKRMTGRTLIDFVNLHRVNQATLLLRQSNMTIADIAEKIGCCNANYFSKMYFRYKGISPSAARKD